MNNPFNPFNLINRFKKKELRVVEGVPVQGFSSGTAGTEIYGGYIYEEPLKELQGKQGAEVYNRMRRSDGNIAMIMRAIKLPIRSASWSIQCNDKTPEAEAQKKLFEHILFSDLGKPWTRFTGEALTFVDFGYSLFEKTFKPVIAHPEFGSYVGIKNLGFRGQRTIERWIVDDAGQLLAVEQHSQGDTGRMVKIDQEHLMHFCPDQEGDNFEGISFLRACYGSFYRKDLYLKLLAAGIEKYAIPVPVLTIPSGKENSVEYENALKVLRRYTSNQTNYITKPAGWDLDIKVTTLDPQKIRDSIKDENQEMVNSVLAGFLMLGQTNSGSFSLGSTLGDFFGTAVQFLGDHICEVFNDSKTGVLADLARLNFGEELKCRLVVEGIKDSASGAFADVVQKLIASGAIKPDAELETFIRDKFNLPNADPSTTYAPAPAAPKFSEMQLAEKKRPDQSKLIRESAGEIRTVVENYLTFLGVQYIEKMKKAFKNSTEIQKLKIPNETEMPSFVGYREILTSISMIQAAKAVAPIKSSLKLASTEEKIEKVQAMMIELNEAIEQFEVSKSGHDALRIGYLERSIRARLASIRGELSLSRENIASLNSRVETMTNTQIGDLKKKIDLQYQSSVGSTDSEMTLFNDLDQARLAFNTSPVIYSGPDILASQNINESILTETSDEPEVESYTFVAVDDASTTDICSELNGRTFSKDDPDLFRYHPPLHHNCRSYMAVNLRSFKGNPEVTSGGLSLSKSAQGDITLAEELHAGIFGFKKNLDHKGGLL